MLHATYTQGNRGDSWLLVVRSQTGSLTLGPSFGHNLCFRYPNEQCEPILDIYILRDFQWYKERYKPLSFGRWNLSLKFWESTGTPSPKVGVALGEWGFTPSCSLTLSYTPGSMWCDSRASSRPFTLVTSLPWLPGFLLTCNLVSPCLGRKPKARVATINLTSVADEHKRAYGRYVESYINHIVVSRASKCSRELDIAKIKFKKSFQVLLIERHLEEVCSKMESTLNALLNTWEHS